jgi:hypothetical protein
MYEFARRFLPRYEFTNVVMASESPNSESVLCIILEMQLGRFFVVNPKTNEISCGKKSDGPSSLAQWKRPTMDAGSHRLGYVRARGVEGIIDIKPHDEAVIFTGGKR